MSVEERLAMLTAATQELHERLRVAEERGTEQQTRAEAAEQRAADLLWSKRTMDHMGFLLPVFPCGSNTYCVGCDEVGGTTIESYTQYTFHGPRASTTPPT
eukprot:4332406-Amphidinium_carterae.1